MDGSFLICWTIFFPHSMINAISIENLVACLRLDFLIFLGRREPVKRFCSPFTANFITSLFLFSPVSFKQRSNCFPLKI